MSESVASLPQYRSVPLIVRGASREVSRWLRGGHPCPVALFARNRSDLIVVDLASVPPDHVSAAVEAFCWTNSVEEIVLAMAHDTDVFLHWEGRFPLGESEDIPHYRNVVRRIWSARRELAAHEQWIELTFPVTKQNSYFLRLRGKLESN